MACSVQKPPAMMAYGCISAMGWALENQEWSWRTYTQVLYRRHPDSLFSGEILNVTGKESLTVFCTKLQQCGSIRRKSRCQPCLHKKSVTFCSAKENMMFYLHCIFICNFLGFVLFQMLMSCVMSMWNTKYSDYMCMWQNFVFLGFLSLQFALLILIRNTWYSAVVGWETS